MFNRRGGATGAAAAPSNAAPPAPAPERKAMTIPAPMPRTVPTSTTRIIVEKQ
jgi:hypothetical protein